MHTLGKTALRTVRLAVSAALTIGVLLPVASAQATNNCCKLSESQAPVQNAFRVFGSLELVVNNISGPIHVIGDGSGESGSPRLRLCVVTETGISRVRSARFTLMSSKMATAFWHV